MKTLMIGACSPNTNFFLTDPDELSEIELEAHTIRILSCIYPEYTCFVFGGGFFHEGSTHRPDLAMVAKNYSHWFVIEVELLSHSLRGHVIPQVCAFRYGDYQPDCVKILARELDIDQAQAVTLLTAVPKTVAVILNKWNDEWYKYLDAHNIQLVEVQHYTTIAGEEAVQLEGYLRAPSQSIGFGTYSAVDRSIRIRPAQALHEGEIQIYAPDGTPGLWTVRLEGAMYWLTKTVGTPSIPDKALIQILMDESGMLSMRHHVR